jgi:Protein of unknown function (DUF3761)
MSIGFPFTCHPTPPGGQGQARPSAHSGRDEACPHASCGLTGRFTKHRVNRPAHNYGAAHRATQIVSRPTSSTQGAWRMSVRIVAFIAATIATLGTTAIVLASPANACPSGYYKAASGDCVHRPICGVSTQPPGATALCNDGCWSFSEHPGDDDTCHGHGGVKTAGGNC